MEWWFQITLQEMITIECLLRVSLCKFEHLAMPKNWLVFSHFFRARPAFPLTECYGYCSKSCSNMRHRGGIFMLLKMQET